MSTNTIKILLAAKTLNYSFQVRTLRGAIIRKVYMQKCPLVYITSLLCLIRKRKSGLSSDVNTNNIHQPSLADGYAAVMSRSAKPASSRQVYFRDFTEE